MSRSWGGVAAGTPQRTMSQDVLRQSILDVLELSADAPRPSSGANGITIVARHNAVIPLLEQQPSIGGDNRHVSSKTALAEDARVYEDALRLRDGTIQDLRTQMARERLEHDSRVSELADALRDQSLVTKETTSALASRIDALQFASAHQGMSRERFEAFNQQHVAATVAESAQRSTKILAEITAVAMSTASASCDRALNHLRVLTATAKETVSQRRPSEELAEVQRLLIADHERQFTLMRERIRARVTAAVRRELEIQMSAGVEEGVADRVRETILPAAIAGLTTYVNKAVEDNIIDAIGAERDAAIEEAHRVRVQQESLLRQMQAAHMAHQTLAECREREKDLAAVFDGLDTAQHDLRVAHATTAVEMEGKIASFTQEVAATKKNNVAMRADLRAVASGRQPGSYLSSRKTGSGPSPRATRPVPTPMDATSPPPAVAAASGSLKLSPPSRVDNQRAADLVSPRTQHDRAASGQRSPALSRVTTAAVNRVPFGFTTGAATDYEVTELPLDDLRRHGLTALLRRDFRAAHATNVSPNGIRIAASPTTDSPPRQTKANGGDRAVTGSRGGDGVAPSATSSHDLYSAEERAALLEHRRLRKGVAQAWQ